MKSPTNRIWHVEDPFRNFIGFLLTEPGDINRPIAFLAYDDGGMADDCIKVFQLARHLIAEGDFGAWRYPTSPARILDLRPYGRKESQSPMPAFIYSLRCRPVANEDQDEQGFEYLDVPPVEPRPFCRFLLAELTQRQAKQQRR